MRGCSTMMGGSWEVRTASLVLLLSLLTLHACHGADLQRAYQRSGVSDEVVMLPKKRPFCNAFTGCGRKRAGAAPGYPVQELLRQRQLADDELLNSVDPEDMPDLSRQLAEARMLEAMQDANQAYRRRMAYPIPYNL